MAWKTAVQLSLFVLLFSIGAHAAQLSLTDTTVTHGTPFDVPVVLSTTTNAAGIQFSVTYDATKLRYVGIDEGSFFTSGASSTLGPSTIAPTLNTGTVQDIIIFRTANPIGKTGTATVATLHFTAQAAGDSTIRATGILSDETAAAITLSAGQAQITILNPDTLAPVLSNPKPTTEQSASAPSVTLSIDTNELSTCKYSLTPGTPYAQMTGVLSGTLTHTALVAVKAQTYYLRCMDGVGNANTADYLIVVRVSTPPQAPTKIVVRGVRNKDGSITLTWTAPHDGAGNIVGEYEVWYAASPIGLSSWVGAPVVTGACAAVTPRAPGASQSCTVRKGDAMKVNFKKTVSFAVAARTATTPVLWGVPSAPVTVS